MIWGVHIITTTFNEMFLSNGGRGFEKVVLYENKFTIKDITLKCP